jgi:hypothetical protein
MPIAPDTKDWTWVLERPCAECGFDSGDYAREELATVILANAAEWENQLTREDVKDRPSADRWSVLEYACHMRDVYRIFRERLALMQSQDNPVFANWDQDETAVAERYELQDPAEVSAGLLVAAEEMAAQLNSVTDDQWARPGTRSNGSQFSIETLGLYELHDSIHHLWDVTDV